MPNAVSSRSPAQVRDDLSPAPGAAEEFAGYEADPMARRETLELVRAYYKIRDPAVRKKLFDMTKALGNAAAKED